MSCLESSPCHGTLTTGPENAVVAFWAIGPLTHIVGGDSATTFADLRLHADGLAWAVRRNFHLESSKSLGFEPPVADL